MGIKMWWDVKQHNGRLGCGGMLGSGLEVRLWWDVVWVQWKFRMWWDVEGMMGSLDVRGYWGQNSGCKWGTYNARGTLGIEVLLGCWCKI